MQASPLSTAGEQLFIIVRPTDQRWKGNDAAPTVGTVIPVMETQIDNLELYKMYIKKFPEHRHEVSLSKTIDDQVHKSTVRLMNAFKDMDQSAYSVTQTYPGHVAKLMMSGDIDTPYPLVNLYQYCCPEAPSFAQQVLTKYQFEVYDKSVKNVEHGTLLNEGSPAGGKTLASEVLAVTFASRSPKSAGSARHQVLMTNDTNNGVNEGASRTEALYLKLQELYPKSNKLKIRRLHSPESEDYKLMSKFFNKDSRVIFDNPTNAMFIVQNLLNGIGQSFSDSRKKGDRRYDDNIKHLSIDDAMMRKLEAGPRQGQWATLLAIINEAKRNPELTKEWKKAEPIVELLRNTCIAETDILITTNALAVSTLLSAQFQPLLFVKDEDGRSPSFWFPSIVANFPSLKFGCLTADLLQKGPYLKQLAGNFWGPFANSLLYTSFRNLKEIGIPVASYYTQYRMKNPGWVEYISRTRYNSAMLDGHKDLVNDPHVLFAKQCWLELYGINSNICLVEVENSRSFKEDGSMSTANPAIHLEVVKVMQHIKTKLLHTNVPWNKNEFRVWAISPYTAVVQALKIAIATEVHDPRFNAATIETVQGLGCDIILKVLPGQRLTAFVNKAEDVLVANTRFKSGFAIFQTKESMDPNTYQFKNGELGMFMSSKTSHHYQDYLYLKKNNLVITVNAPDTRSCHKCLKVGHLSEACPYVTGTHPFCRNCFKQGHFEEECGLPKIGNAIFETEKHSKPSKPCQQCGEEGHLKSNCPQILCHRCHEPGHKKDTCPLPWCNHCRSNTHAKQACLKAFCKACRCPGHWTKDELRCPKSSESKAECAII